MSNLEAALGLYRQRAHIETFFSDQQSRSFHLHKSHLCDPIRLTVTHCLVLGLSVAGLSRGLCLTRWLAETIAPAGAL